MAAKDFDKTMSVGFNTDTHARMKDFAKRFGVEVSAVIEGAIMDWEPDDDHPLMQAYAKKRAERYRQRADKMKLGRNIQSRLAKLSPKEQEDLLAALADRENADE